MISTNASFEKTPAVDRSKHPCFNGHSKSNCARIHLPIAAKCNVQCNFCNRKYDCANESRPGVTTKLLTPQQAADYFSAALKKEPRIAVAGIAGPGDPFAEPQLTLETLRLVRERHPGVILCVASNGLNVAPYVDELAALQVSHVTITVNAVDPEIGSQIYSWVRKQPHVYRGLDAGKVLIENQREAITRLKEAGITTKVNTVIIPTINDHHLLDIALEMSDRGVDVLNAIPLCPTEGTPFALLREPTPKEMAKLRQSAQHFIPQMYHCTRCRADAAGFLGQNDEQTKEFAALMVGAATGQLDPADLPVHPAQRRTKVAVASWEGMLINQHLGEATHLWIYERNERGYTYIESRATAPVGGGQQRWLELANRLSDCHTVLVSGVGQSPKELLSHHGVSVLECEGLIDEMLHQIHAGSDLSQFRKRAKSGCGANDGSCSGTGNGCG